MSETGNTICANCGQTIATGATTRLDENGKIRHAEKCGPDLIGMKVQKPVRK